MKGNYTIVVETQCPLAPISKSVCCEAEINKSVLLSDSPRGIPHSVKISDFIPLGRRITNPREQRSPHYLLIMDSNSASISLLSTKSYNVKLRI